MLILTRRVGETIVIGDDVIVTVLGIKGNQVRIGINAPKDVTVHREEIYQRIQQEKNPSDTTASKPAAPAVVTSPAPEDTVGNTVTPPTVTTTTTTIRKKRESKIDKSLNKE